MTSEFKNSTNGLNGRLAISLKETQQISKGSHPDCNIERQRHRKYERHDDQ